MLLGPPGPSRWLPLTLFWLLRFAPRLRSPNSALPSTKRPPRGREEGWSGGPRRGAPSSRGWLGQDLRGQHRPGSRASGRRGGEEESLWGWVWRGWGRSFLLPAAGSGPGGAGEVTRGRPRRGWRRRCRRRSRRGGCCCRSCRRRHCLLLRPRRGESKRKRRRRAGRTPQLDPSLQLQPRPRLSPASLAANDRRAGPEPHGHWPVGVAVRQGCRGREPQLESGFPPQKPGDRPLPPLAPGVSSRRPEPIRQLPRPNPLSYWPLRALGLFWREPQGLKVFGWGSWDIVAGPGHPLSKTPELDHKGRAGLSSGRAWCRGKQTARSEGCDQGLGKTLVNLSSWS